ncbi:hypothetical protein RF11_13096 [Thelohanellus kitauei]|uniref:Tc1-like transposase DDE domain-containing protein n=1 Tax=Thelohanellus kitauei TaxID=669202 RepID=A0A0C2JS00_THEKT|nr:hypothetical protein RF11_13096 [Thelohanellus kitauei]
MLIYPKFIGYGKNIKYQEKLLKYQKAGIVILCDIVEDDCSLTLENLSDRFFNATNIRIIKKTVARYLKEYNYSFEKIKFIPERRIIASTIKETHDYVIKYLEYSLSNRFILFFDETGI